MSMCFPLGCQVQISSPTEMCFFFFFNSRSSCDTATGVAQYMTGKLAFVHKQDLSINKLCDCRCKVSGTVPPNQRCEFIENSTELNRQKSCKNRIHSWLHAPLSLCTIYCSHQVRGWLVGVGVGGEEGREWSILEVCSSSYSGTFCSRRRSYPLSSWIHAATPRGRPSPAPAPRARRGPASSAFLHGTCHVARVALLRHPRQVSRPQKKAQI